MRVLCSLLVLLALVAPRPVEAAWAENVAWAGTFASGSSTTLGFTYGSAVAGGDGLFCFITGGHATNGIPKDVTDSVNGAWTQTTGTGIPVSAGLGVALTLWFKAGSAVGTPAVTITYPASVTNRGTACGSYSGLDQSSPFDVARGNGQTNPCAGGGNCVTTSATGTTATSNELAIAFTMTQTGVTIAPGTTLAWSERLDEDWGGVYRVQVEHINIATPATVTATWVVTNAAADFESIVSTFKEPSASGVKKCLLLGVCGDEGQ